MRRRHTGWMVLLAFLGSTTGAAAHYVYERVYVYQSNGNCVRNRSEVSHGDANGYTKVNTVLLKPFGGVDCALVWDQSTGRIAARTLLYVWTSRWALCAKTKWKFNVEPAGSVERAKYWNLPCSVGNYGQFGGSYANINGGGWKGGYQWSGYHHLPDS